MSASHVEDAARRRFLQGLGGVGLAFGAGPLLKGCGGGQTPASPVSGTESRTYYLNLAGGQPGATYVLEVGTRHHPLVPATARHIKAAERDMPGLGRGAFTHVAEEVDLPADSPQLCFVKGRDPARAGAWHLHSMFNHVPAAGEAAAAACASPACTVQAASMRARFLAATGAPLASAAGPTNFCTRYTSLKDQFDQACAMIGCHPELLSFDPASLAYIQQNIICTEVVTQDLALSLYYQGAALLGTAADIPTVAQCSGTGSSAFQGWGVLVPATDPDTGQPLVDANGAPVTHTFYSCETMRLLGAAIAVILPRVKNDPHLGANITALAPDTANAEVAGKLWVVRNGSATVQGAIPPVGVSPLSAGALAVAASLQSTGGAAATDSLQFAQRDIENSAGCSITYNSNTGREISFTVKNWYLRYLGLYARFLDANGQPIPLSSLDATSTGQFHYPRLNGTYDGYISLVNQEIVLLGIPLKSASQDFTVSLPQQAASVVLLAGGIGSGPQTYPETIVPGMVMTAVMDLALPSVFMILGAGTGYAKLMGDLSAGGEIIADAAQFFVQAMVTAGLVGNFGQPVAFTSLVLPLANMLRKMVTAGATTPGLSQKLLVKILEYLEVGEIETKIVLIGQVLLAVAALGIAAQITETAVEVGRSHWTLAREVVATHDLTVTVGRDPLDTAGFPATATRYQLTAVCDGSSPRVSGWLALANPNVDTVAYTFAGLPSGGQVTVTAVFVSADGWVAGAGTTPPLDNTLDTAALTITEVLVPLTGATVYAHKRKSLVDGSGKHAWLLTSQPPAEPVPACGNAPGSLCLPTGITLNEPAGSLGFEWQASSAGVTSFANGARGQLYQFGALSFTGNAQAGVMFSGSGLPQAPRLVYDRSPGNSGYYVDSSSGSSIVRRVYLNGPNTPPTFDAPGSNRAVGRLNYAPDALLFHSTGKLISLSSAQDRMEVLIPSTDPVVDASAPMAVALSGSGTRLGLISGPVAATVSRGHILVLERGNNRVQAFDTGANPAALFGGNTTPFLALKARSDVTYLDLAAENTGYVYVLVQDGSLGVFAMDIYDPDGNFVSTTNDVRASKFAIDLFRNAYMLNFEPLLVNGRVEPSISEWVPST